MAMQSMLIVFFGGGLGSLSRFVVGKWISSLHPQSFPWGTLTVNVLSCAILGVIIGLADHRQIISPPARLFWTVGFCGGFSTFSTFSSEALQLMQDGFAISLVLYVVCSLVLCLSAIWGGLALGQLL